MNKIQKMLNGEIDYLEGLAIIIGTQHIADSVVATLKIDVADKEGYVALMSLLQISNEVKEQIFIDKFTELVSEFNVKFGMLCKEMNGKGNVEGSTQSVLEELVKRMN